MSSSETSESCESNFDSSEDLSVATRISPASMEQLLDEVERLEEERTISDEWSDGLEEDEVVKQALRTSEDRELEVLPVYGPLSYCESWQYKFTYPADNPRRRNTFLPTRDSNLMPAPGTSRSPVAHHSSQAHHPSERRVLTARRCKREQTEHRSRSTRKSTSRKPRRNGGS